ncbi:hypothetical protein E1A91_A01G144500v1 [Gossypium mustelinum]|uniref:Uncharacterized protein n=1 Tax=Gossypium mustelinum TaxID=34275 RepID=A0A5D3AHH1_GOSMU|nr:hypothetical protein E1A91_A01G144500v1 [Gossypium mustelinum]
MGSLLVPSPLLLPSLSRSFLPKLQSQPQHISPRISLCNQCPFRLSFQSSFPRKSLCSHRSLAGAFNASSEGTVSVINIEDFNEKDWSFLDSEELNSEQAKRNIDRITSAGEISESSRVLVSVGSEGFVDHLVESSTTQLLLVVHDSIFFLAGIKEKYDEVKCWQGELIYVPEKWTPFDVIFLYFLPALLFELDQIFAALAKRCSSGARVVISHPQGREVLEQQRKEFPDIVNGNLPDKTTLQKVAADHSFEMTEFVDEPGFYLAVLKFSEAN